MKVILTKPYKRPPKADLPIGHIWTVTNKRGRELIKNNQAEEYTGQVIEQSKPRTKDNPKKEQEQE